MRISDWSSDVALPIALAKAPARTAPAPKKTASTPAPATNRETPRDPVPYDATPEELEKFYREMLLIRRFEEKPGQLYGLGLTGGFCHLYIDQEAVAVGMLSALGGDKYSAIPRSRHPGPMTAYSIHH